MPKAFLSYAEEDAMFAVFITQKLKDADVEVWIDADDVPASGEWRNAIDEGITSSDAIVVVITPESCKSPYVTYEWAYALACGIKVIPVLLRDAKIHPRLEVLQHLDFRGRKKEPWDNLCDEITKRGALADKGRSYNIRRHTGVNGLKAVSEKLKSVTKVYNTRIATPECCDPLYTKEIGEQWEQAIVEAVNRGVAFTDIVGEGGGTKAASTILEQLGSGEHHRYVAKKTTTDFPGVINYKVLFFEDGSREVWFGWRCASDRKILEDCFESTYRELVDFFEDLFIFMESQALIFVPATAATPPSVRGKRRAVV